MDARVQRRVQRYGWDLAAAAYEPLWAAHLAPAQQLLLARAAPAPGERVLDVACGTGLVSLAAAARVGRAGSVVGVDLSGAMVDAARARAPRGANVTYARMDGEALDLPDRSFDAALCALGLMYMPAPRRALAQMRRVLRPGGRVAAAVWGERARCGWSAVFPIVEAEVASDVCPLFFALGGGDALARACEAAGFVAARLHRIAVLLDHASLDAACDAAFAGGPVALAWSRFDAAARERARRRYAEAIAPWRVGARYRLPAEFVIATATVPGP